MSFSAQIAKFGENASKRIQEVRRGVIIKLFSSVILDTPVDTGRLRANWLVSIGAPKKQTTEQVDKSGRVPIAAVQDAAKQSDGDTSVYLSNNLPYAARIEFEGWSKIKAPEGMVRRNVVRFGRLISIEVRKKQ